ncbi:hypothetical protein BBW65_01730 [Helicobacter enhydrae]|uniref:Uncharacterized protein n=1 Tax=Helicobacter enhydrae TaxID=222136 RepID=A0A1B1U493_9HELI|nr:hypothetical protein BBW65_01730 [Helicobacter enhydrae]
MCFGKSNSQKKKLRDSRIPQKCACAKAISNKGINLPNLKVLFLGIGLEELYSLAILKSFWFYKVGLGSSCLCLY